MRLDVRSLSELSTTFNEAATRLSGTITDFQMFLDSLPGKVEAEVENKYTRLKYARNASNWGLLVPDDTSNLEDMWTPLTASSVLVKCHAVSLFPALVSAMQDELTERIKLINDASNAMEKLKIKVFKS